MKILTQSEWKRLPKEQRLRSEGGKLYVLHLNAGFALTCSYVELLPKQRRKARRK